MLILLISFGFKNTFKRIYRYPSIVILPTFSFWTFGPSRKLNGCWSNNENKLILSIKHTWINFGLSLAVSLIVIPFADFQRDRYDDFVLVGAEGLLYILAALSTFRYFTPMPEFIKPFCCIKQTKWEKYVKLSALDPSQPDLLIIFPE